MSVNEPEHSSKYFLGLDSSTQSITALLINDIGHIVLRKSVQFADQRLAHYAHKDGMLISDDPLVAHANPLLWVEALELVLIELQNALKKQGKSMGQVVAVGGSSQQHGTVYVRDNFISVLKNADAGRSLAPQLIDVFSRRTSPIWMDASTSKDCQAIHDHIGSPEQVACITGSSATERFSGPQIRKFSREEPESYAETAHIYLISSFMASVMAAQEIGSDHSDASGTNLLDVQTKKWNLSITEFCGKKLHEKLGVVQDSGRSVATISHYFQERFGFSDTCTIMPWCGDNPAALLGLGLLEAGPTAISLGTSDTLFGAIERFTPFDGGIGHIFCAPQGGYMPLLCFKNGSLAREVLREIHHISWLEFSDALESVEPVTAFCLPWQGPEQVPQANAGVIYAKKDGEIIEAHSLANELSPAQQIRSFVEGQLFAMRSYAERAGLQTTELRVTGGASENIGILRIMADVFGVPVYVLDMSDAAALGAAFQAARSQMTYADWKMWVQSIAEDGLKLAVKPDRERHEIYSRALFQYEAFEAAQLAQQAADITI